MMLMKMGQNWLDKSQEKIFLIPKSIFTVKDCISTIIGDKKRH